MARTHRGVPIRSADELVKARQAAQLAAEVQVFAVKYRAERQRKRAAQADVASGNQVVKP